MRGAATLCTLGTVLLSLFHAINAIHIGDTGSPKVVRFDLQQREIPNPIKSDRLRKRSKKVVKTKLINDIPIYICEVRVGNPPQKLTLYVDTGSSDLWTNVANTTFHGKLAGYKPKRAYNPGASSTAASLSSDFRISYADGSSASGDYFRDTLRIGNVKLPNFQFGLGYTSNSQEGVMGIGYPENEIQVTRNRKPPYPNLPFALKNAGLIKSASYGIWLNSIYSRQGSLIFGGIDQAKYYGKLQTTPIIPNRYGMYREVVVSLTEISVRPGKGKGFQHVDGEFPIPALLDTGCSLTYLPPRVTQAIYQVVGAMYNKQWDLAVIPCAKKRQDAKITFKFGTSTAAAFITINLAQLILPLPRNDDGSPIAPAQSGLCLFGIFPMSDKVKLASLGTTFLRQTYVFVNLEKHEVGMAVAKSNVWRETIKEVSNAEGGRPPTEHLMRRHRLATTPSTTTSPMKAFAMPMAQPDMYIGALVGLVSVIFALM
ncbi:hypothetical protein ACJ72_06752 [Emergomyces africanus]|uniref:Peptidase A1 domain-containing protein n=1 Tax=Emergomyces africanus TaxID=1955775 RepID=A0A1B7NQ32_9EURO|nr:hypothetical protein ACJ72_06752 [Emergomyces africanus]